MKMKEQVIWISEEEDSRQQNNTHRDPNTGAEHNLGQEKAQEARGENKGEGRIESVRGR